MSLLMTFISGPQNHWPPSRVKTREDTIYERIDTVTQNFSKTKRLYTIVLHWLSNSQHEGEYAKYKYLAPLTRNSQGEIRFTALRGNA